MESTPRPITGYQRALPQRVPFPLSGLAKGLMRVARPEPLAIVLSRPAPEEAVVEIRGALTAKGAQRLKLAVFQALEEGARQVTVDLAEASRLDPAGLAALVEATQRAGEARVYLANLSAEARWLLEKASLHTVLEITE